MAAAARHTRGRQRIPMQLIENLDDLYATFSKRRRGLFKKACELSTLCGVDLGIIIFSPTNNPFSLWHPSMVSVIARFRNPNEPLDNETRAIDNITHERIRVFNGQLDELLDQKEQINSQVKTHDDIDKIRDKVWWEQVPLESMQKEQADELEKWFEDILSNIKTCIQELETEALGSTVVYSASFPSTFSQGYFPGSSMGMMGPSPPPFHDQNYPFTSGTSLLPQFPGSLSYLPPYAGDLYQGASMAAPPQAQPFHGGSMAALPQALPPPSGGYGSNPFTYQHYGGDNRFTSGASVFSQFQDSLNYFPRQLTQGPAPGGFGRSQDYPHPDVQHGTSFIDQFPGQYNYFPQEGEGPSGEPSAGAGAGAGAYGRGNYYP